jgi:hypothetical protein
MYKYIYILVALVIILILIQYQSKENDIVKVPGNQIPKELANHVSMLVDRRPNIFKFPLYYLSSPKEYIVNKGEFIFIPYGWWHWVESYNHNDDYSFAVTYWYLKDTNNTPFVGHFTDIETANSLIDLFDKGVETYQYDLNVWCSDVGKKTLTMKQLLNDNINKCYMATLRKYTHYPNNNNNVFFDNFKQYVPKPEYLKDIISETIFWVNNGNIEAPLHYDRYYGLLCIISGQKKVTLFPPSDGRYLYPHGFNTI